MTCLPVSILYLSEIILEQLMHSEKAMIEAPLGSGKSFAYLLDNWFCNNFVFVEIMTCLPVSILYISEASR
jgi:hypothetical protein